MIPNWLKRLPDDAYLNSDEIKQVFGFSQKTPIFNLQRNGSVPEPDWRSKRMAFRTQSKPLWNVGRIKKILRSKEYGITTN